MRRGRESLWPRTIYSMCGANDTRIEFPLHTCRYIGRAKSHVAVNGGLRNSRQNLKKEWITADEVNPSSAKRASTISGCQGRQPGAQRRAGCNPGRWEGTGTAFALSRGRCVTRQMVGGLCAAARRAAGRLITAWHAKWSGRFRSPLVLEHLYRAVKKFAASSDPSRRRTWSPPR